MAAGSGWGRQRRWSSTGGWNTAESTQRPWGGRASTVMGGGGTRWDMALSVSGRENVLLPLQLRAIDGVIHERLKYIKRGNSLQGP